MTKGTMLTLSAAAIATASTTTNAQLAIDWHTIDGGSAVMTGGTFELRETVGQPDAGEVRTNAISSMGGFWSVGYTFCLAT